LHQSGVGGIKYYYNYAITTPFYGDISLSRVPHTLKNEKAHPGYYSAEIQDIFCEMTVSGGVAYHRYTFANDNGRVAVDFSNNGLSKKFEERFWSDVKNPEIEILGNNQVTFSGIFSGVKLYFFVFAEGEAVSATLFEGTEEKSTCHAFPTSDPYGVVFDFSGRSVSLKVSYSTVSAEHARKNIMESLLSFDEARADAYNIWNDHLSVIRIESDDEELKQKFYSNLYHSLIKPADMTGENILGVEADTVTDFATFWDQYKTELPLIYACYPEMSKKIVSGIVNISRTFGKIPCSFGLCDIFSCEEQDKMLGVLSLCDAYHMGIDNITVEAIEECVARELARDDYDQFLREGRFERYTHILDVTDACLCVAQIAENQPLKDRLLKLSEYWRNAYAQDGLMSEASRYYEGDRYTYSFRIQKNMIDRIELAGGKERFASMLDAFFGFGCESVKQLTYIGADEEISQKQYHRFEGFNNECDMEVPYAYIYADRHDRLCEIMHECVSRSFGLGTGGLPGNNDSGGLSSAFIWNALGIFPASGSGEFLIGAPQIDSADIELSTGKRLEIRVDRKNKRQIYVDRVEWNGEPIRNYRISMKDIIGGGSLHFYMK
jgi:putative alpha-1,2-mannosidase